MNQPEVGWLISTIYCRTPPAPRRRSSPPPRQKSLSPLSKARAEAKANHRSSSSSSSSSAASGSPPPARSVHFVELCLLMCRSLNSPSSVGKKDVLEALPHLPNGNSSVSARAGLFCYMARLCCRYATVTDVS